MIRCMLLLFFVVCCWGLFVFLADGFGIGVAVQFLWGLLLLFRGCSIFIFCVLVCDLVNWWIGGLVLWGVVLILLRVS